MPTDGLSVHGKFATIKTQTYRGNDDWPKYGQIVNFPKRPQEYALTLFKLDTLLFKIRNTWLSLKLS